MGLFGIEAIKLDQNKLALEIHNLSKRIKKKEILQPIDYKLSKGKILALCGGNGAGKSTLIRMIIGLIKPTTGHVMINGLSRKKDNQNFLNQLGYMPDHFQFQKSMTTKETLHFYAKIKQIDQMVYMKTLKEVGLYDKLDEKVGNFSKGMNQRLLLAQLLMADPHIIILDEPTNGLDPYWVKRFSELMLRAKHNGQTVIFSTHDLHVAEQISDEVIFLSDGKVISHGPVEKYTEVGLYETFQNLYFEAIHDKSLVSSK